MLTLELDKAIALVFICHFVSWNMHVHHRPGLNEQLPNQLLIHPAVNVAYVNSCFLVSLKQWSS